MAKRVPEPTKKPRERCILVGVELDNHRQVLTMEASLSELQLLADTAGLNVVGELTQKLERPNPKTFIGKGKVAELKNLAEEKLADIILFDDELSPRHQRELEEIFGGNVRVLDRTALILDIFAQHARTREGALQVELAQYEYRLPRLTRAWSHLARQAGGGGGRAGSVGGVGLRGPGETQLEVDRREIRRRIDVLKRELEKVSAHRERYRAQRKKARIPVIALVGYTNAGKSTLLNQLSDAGVYVADKLFATLDPTTRKVMLPGKKQVLFTDTVGFIQKLPTTLVAAFRATLDEIVDADMLLHVMDISHPNVRQHAEAVHDTLEEIGAEHIPLITVLNKIDLLPEPEKAKQILQQFGNAAAISAITGDGLPELLEMVSQRLFDTYLDVELILPYREGKIISLIHHEGRIIHEEHVDGGIKIKAKVPGRLAAQIRRNTKYLG